MGPWTGENRYQRTLFYIGTCVGLVTLVVSRAPGRFGPIGPYLFRKEGPLEALTFLLLLLAAAWLATAAHLERKAQERRTFALFSYAACALLLFVIGMEEVSWGQTFFNFETPASWAAINHQQETTLHNLFSREALTSSARIIGAVFGLGAVALMWAARRDWGRWLRPISPPLALLVLAVCAAFGGMFIHAEVVEFLIAVFFALYAHNILRLQRSPALAPAASEEPISQAPLFETGSSSPRLLITGATGFIGSRLALRAHAQGHRIIAVGMAKTETERERVAELRNAGVELHLGDLGDRRFLERVVIGCQGVIHLAAAQHEANVPEEYFTSVNVHGSRNLLDASVRAGVRRFVYGGTIGVYGSADHGPLDEASPLRPDNAYARSKAAAEALVRDYGKRLETVILRISETYGPGDIRLLKLFKALARRRFVMIGEGDNVRQPIHVEDLVRGLLLAATHPAASGETFVLAGPEALTTRRMIESIQAALGAPARIRRAPLWPIKALAWATEWVLKPIGVQPPLHRRRLDFFEKSFYFDTRKASTELGFSASISFARGALDAARWYSERGLLQGKPQVDGSQADDAPIAQWPERSWRYSEILEYTHDAIIIWEMGAQGIVYWNGAAARLYGYSREQAVGRVTHGLLKTRLPGGVEHLEQQLTRHGVWSGQLLHTTSGGRHVLVQARLALMAEQNGRWLVLEINRDVATDYANPEGAIAQYCRALQA